MRLGLELTTVRVKYHVVNLHNLYLSFTLTTISLPANDPENLSTKNTFRVVNQVYKKGSWLVIPQVVIGFREFEPSILAR